MRTAYPNLSNPFEGEEPARSGLRPAQQSQFSESPALSPTRFSERALSDSLTLTWCASQPVR